jgi:exportin-7
MFLNWFYPKYMSVLKRGLETLSPHPEAVVLLKFFGEFVHNKNQRLNLDVSSPQGVLLFRDASQIINTFGKKRGEFFNMYF